MPNTGVDLYAVIKERIPLLVNSISNLPNCPVWIHEKALYKVLQLTSGPTFGPRAILDCLMREIDRGYCGSKKGNHVRVSFVVPNFCPEKSDNRIWATGGLLERELD